MLASQTEFEQIISGHLGAVHRSEEGVYVEDKQHHEISSSDLFF
jgi:hypothetical protein